MENLKKFTVVGVREVYQPADEWLKTEQHIISLVDEFGEEFEVSLSCGTEIAVAPFAFAFGNYKLERGWVEKPTHEPIDKNLSIELEYPAKEFNTNSKDISNSVFEVSNIGYDLYYPSGYYTINMELFKEI